MRAPIVTNGRKNGGPDTHTLPPVDGAKGVGKPAEEVLLPLAQRYQAAGYSIIVVGGDKRPTGTWRDAQQRMLTEDELRRDLRRGGTGLAVVGGKVSGGLTIIDFDVDKDSRAQTPLDLEAEFVDPCIEGIGSLIDASTIPRQRTPSGGWQFYFRSPEPLGNTKVAGVPAWQKKKGEVLVGTKGSPHYAIETRGEGGFAVIPTPDSGRAWADDLDLTNTPYVEQPVADAILLVARQLDRIPAPPKPTPKVHTQRVPMGEGDSVIAAYNARYSLEDVLERYGYEQQGNNRWLAPNSSSGAAGVVVYIGTDGVQRVASHHSSDELRVEGVDKQLLGSDAFGVFTLLEHGGDVPAAVKAAAAELGLAPQRSLTRPHLQVTSEAGAPEPDLLGYNRTDYGNAERLHALYGRVFRYSAALGFIVWDGRRWRPDEDDAAMMRLALETARTLFAQAAGLESQDTRETWVKYSLSCERSAALKSAIDLARSIPGVSIGVAELDADMMLLNIESGTINLRDGTIRAHDPTDLITKLAPVTYDPEAECPQWLEFQNRICAGDDDLIAFKQRAYGYSLTGDTGEDCLFIPYGKGANGKSTELSVIGELMGDYANTAQFETFAVKKSEGVRNDVADLVGARFVSASEGENRQRLAEGLVKQMTGGDILKARFLHKEYFRFKPALKLWLATNHKPVIRGTDEGIWRRIRLIPYTITIPLEQRDKRLRAKLDGERAGILNWLLIGCTNWHQHGLGSAEAVNAATAEYRLESDALADFIAARCVTGDEYAERAGDIYRAYERWCGENSEDAYSSQLFGRMLTERGYTTDQAKQGGKVYKLRRGICLSENAGEKGAG